MSMVTGERFGDKVWFDAWHQAFAANQKRYTIAVPGIEPAPDLIEGTMKIFRRRFACLRAPANSHTPRYGWRINELPSATDLCRSLREALRTSRMSGIEIGLTPENGTTAKLLNSLSAEGWAVSIEEAEQAHLLDLSGDWDAYRKNLSSNLTKTLNWKENKLKRLGRFSFFDAAQGEEWANWFEEALTLEAKGWKGEEGSAILRRPNEALFYRTVARSAAEERRLRLYCLTIDDRLVAFQLLVLEEGVLYLLKLAYDESFGTVSPGAVLQRLILKESLADPAVQTLDLGGPGEWKLRWAPRTERLMKVRLAPSASLAGLLLRLEMTAKRLRGRLERNAARESENGTAPVEA